MQTRICNAESRAERLPMNCLGKVRHISFCINIPTRRENSVDEKFIKRISECCRRLLNKRFENLPAVTKCTFNVEHGLYIALRGKIITVHAIFHTNTAPSKNLLPQY